MIRISLFCCFLALAGAPQARAEAVPDLATIRAEARERLRQRTIEDWTLRTLGKSPKSSPTSPNLVVTKEILAFLRDAAASADSADRRELLYLENDLVSEAVRLASASSLPEARPAVEDSVIRMLGYRDYVTFSEQLRGFRFDDLMAGAFRFIQQTDMMYRTLLSEQARRLGGPEPVALKSGDLIRLLEQDPSDAAFPPALMTAAFQDFLTGLGLDLRTAGGAEIRIDASGRPAQNARAACLPVDVPDDIRISVHPSSGLSDYQMLFHEGGHAVHFANAPAEPWELSHLGPAAVTEGVGVLFAGVWSHPEWLRHYREFAGRTAGGKDVAEVLTDVEIARIGRRQLLRDLCLFRRYAGASMLFGAILHRSDPELYRPYFFEGETIPPQELYRQITGFATGVNLGAGEGIPYTEDLDPFFLSADYVRGFGLAALLEEQFQQRFGDNWFLNPEAGAWLKSEVFAQGNRLAAEEVAALLGVGNTISFEPLKTRLMKRFTETEAVIEKARR